MTDRRAAMCLMAHPDDCEMLCAGTLALLAARGWEVHIVTMTPGDAGSMEKGPEEIAAIRRAEGAAAAAQIGAAYHCLESRDLYITYDEATLRRAMSLTRAIAPGLMVTHSLDDYMMDHEVTARIARGVSFGHAIPNVAPEPIPPGARVPHLYCADPVEGVDAFGNAVKPGTLVNITEMMETKRAMLRAHASQREWLMKHHGLDEYVRGMEQWAAKRGQEMGVAFAEGFRQHRGHAFPKDCILTDELSGLVKTKS